MRVMAGAALVALASLVMLFGAGSGDHTATALLAALLGGAVLTFLVVMLVRAANIMRNGRPNQNHGGDRP
jgi:hypothetical protein